MQVRMFCLAALFVGACTTDALAQGENFDTSLHRTLKGKETWYNAENGGFENWTGVPIEQLGCLQCHGAHDANGDPYPDDWFAFVQDCTDCHQVEGGGFVDQDQCFTCHSQQSFEIDLWEYPDVHRQADMVCWDCHPHADMMGDGTPYPSLLAPGAIKADCESADCHPPGSLSEQHDEYDPEDLHHGTIHCNACHTQSSVGCFNCHLESVVESNVYRWQQPINGFTMVLNRHRDDKLSSAAFHGITYQGDAMLAVAPYRSHTNTVEARAYEYNTTGIIKFTDWDEDTGTLTWNQGLVFIPTDWRKRMKFDFIEYDGPTTDPMVWGDPNWSKIGKTTPDGAMMLWADPLTREQMKSLGYATAVEVDLKPGGCPNPLNVSALGLYPAVIYGTDEYDIDEIDWSSIRLEGVAPIRMECEDVGAPDEDALCGCPDDSPDGHMDLVLKFSNRELATALGATTRGEERMLVLTGFLTDYDPTLGPVPIVGNDCVIIRGKLLQNLAEYLSEPGIIEVYNGFEQ
jgi:hypothetical protein